MSSPCDQNSETILIHDQCPVNFKYFIVMKTDFSLPVLQSREEYHANRSNTQKLFTDFHSKYLTKYDYLKALKLREVYNTFTQFCYVPEQC